MYCSKCGKEVKDEARFCNVCGNPTVSISPTVTTTEKRPIAGIVVGTILGTFGLIWSSVTIYRLLYSNPEGVQAQLFQLFPGFQGITFFSSSLGLTSSVMLLIGVLLSFLSHVNGNKTIRITSYCMIVASLLMTLLSFFVATGASSWETIDGPVKGGLIGGMIGGCIGNIFSWGLLLFLFRKSRWP